MLISLQTHISAERKSGLEPRSPISDSAPKVIESGKFRIYELKQVQGEETYSITGGPDGLGVKARLDLPCWREELKPLLNATLLALTEAVGVVAGIAGLLTERRSRTTA